VRNASLDGVTLRTAEQDLVLDDAGLYPMAAAPGCTEGYHGAFPSATLYVAGRGTDKEKLFTRKDYDGAQSYARGHDVDLAHLGTKQLCHETVLEFLGA